MGHIDVERTRQCASDSPCSVLSLLTNYQESQRYPTSLSASKAALMSSALLAPENFLQHSTTASVTFEIIPPTVVLWRKKFFFRLKTKKIKKISFFKKIIIWLPLTKYI